MVIKFQKLSLLASLLIASLGFSVSASATGLMECDSDKSQWQTMQALQTKLEGEGWQIKKIKVDAGCYEAYATTPEGDKVEAYFDPVTFEKLLVARRGIVLFKKRVLFEKGEAAADQ